MDEIELERRLGKIEGQLIAASSVAIVTQQAQLTAGNAQHTAVMEKLVEVKTTVLQQNGRIGKLESWRTQEATLLALLVAAGPFVFWALNRWAGG